MDVYSELSTPFDVAAYCRGRKLCIESARLKKALEHRNEAKERLVAAERDMANCESAVAMYIEAVRLKMEKE